MSYYFAYGSNLDVNRMTSRCPSAEVVGIGELEGYKLTFMENNSKNCVANIVKRKGESVIGVIYSIKNGDDWRYLDKCEGHPYVYMREDIEVELDGDKIVTCSVYIMDEDKIRPVYFKAKGGKVAERYESIKREVGVPKKDYLRYLVNGYKQHQLELSELSNILYNLIDELMER